MSHIYNCSSCRHEFLCVSRLQCQLPGAELVKELFSAGKNDDLDIPSRHIQYVEHTSHPPIIRKDQRVIKDNGCRATLLH